MLGLFIVVVIAQSGDAADAAEAYRDLYHRLAGIHSLEGEEQVLRKGKWQWSGRFKILRPNLFRYDSQEFVFVGDGTTVWHRAKTTWSWPADSDRTALNMFGFEQFYSPDNINYQFDGIRNVSFNGRIAREITMHFSEGRGANWLLYLDKETGMPIGWSLAQHRGTATGRYVNLKINPSLRRSDFVFRVPH